MIQKWFILGLIICVFGCKSVDKKSIVITPKIEKKKLKFLQEFLLKIQ